MTESISIEGRWIIPKKKGNNSGFEFNGLLIIRPGNPAFILPDHNILDGYLRYCNYGELQETGEIPDASGNYYNISQISGRRNASQVQNISAIPLITGKGVNGSEITLIDNRFISGILPESDIFSGITGENIHDVILSDSVIEGYRFKDNSEVTFCTIVIFPDDLINWISYDNYMGEVFGRDDSEVVIYSSDKFSLSLSKDKFPGEKRSGDYLLNDALTVRYPGEKNLNDVKDDLRTIQFFLSFMMDKPSFFWHICGYRERDARLSDYAGKKILSFCNIYFSSSELNDRKFLDYSSYGNYLISFGDIKDNFERYYTGWQKFTDSYGSLAGLYFSAIFNPRMYKENRFLAYVECLEIYHRKNDIFRNYLIDPDEYDERIYTVKKLLGENKVFTKKIRESIVNTLKFGNKPNLENRLNDLCYFFREYLSPYIDDYEKFASDVSVNRNYIVHREAKEGFSYADGYELEQIIIRLDLIIHLIFLYESGFDAEFTEETVERFFRKRIKNINLSQKLYSVKPEG